MKTKRMIQVLAAVIVVAGPSLMAQGTDTRSQVFKASAGGALRLSVESGDVEIRVGGGSQVQVRGFRLIDPDQNLRMWQEGSTVYVEYETRWSRRGGARFEIDVPEQFDIDFTTSGGDARIKGNLVGNLTGRTSGGDLDFGDVDGEVDLKTSGGDIQGGALASDALVKTSGGDIILARVGARLDAHTSGGDIEVDEVGGSLDAKTSGGDIRADSVGGEAAVKTAGGDIQLGRVSQTAILKTSGGDIELDSATGDVEAVTSGGDVRLNEVVGSVQAKTSGGDVEVRLTPEGQRESVLSSSGGDLVLFLPASARVTVEATIKGSSRGRWSRHRDDSYKIRSDFEATSREDTDREQTALFEINGGGPLITMTTTHGNILIRRDGRQ